MSPPGAGVVMRVRCAVCGAPPWSPCRVRRDPGEPYSEQSKERPPHAVRVQAAAALDRWEGGSTKEVAT